MVFFIVVGALVCVDVLSRVVRAADERRAERDWQSILKHREGQRKQGV
jgi:hypothetical protein